MEYLLHRLIALQQPSGRPAIYTSSASTKNIGLFIQNRHVTEKAELYLHSFKKRKNTVCTFVFFETKSSTNLGLTVRLP